MALNLAKLSISFLLLLLLENPFSIVESRTIKPSKDSFTQSLQNLKGVQKGQTQKGIGELKNYLKRFGYLNIQHDATPSTTLNDHFDENLEFALKDFQTYHHLHVTGRVDTTTIKILSLPRCGVPDLPKHSHKQNGLEMSSSYAFFQDSPKWSDTKRNLKYMYKSSVDVLSMDVVRKVCENAFLSWSEVSDFTFTEVGDEGSADIKIGFHRGNHGDVYPFDGPGNVLAHTFPPEDGRLHFDGDENWTNNPTSLEDNFGLHAGLLGKESNPFQRPTATTKQFDLETVALHEMGHLLGLAHSTDQNSAMYPYWAGVRRNLNQDDVDGITALYVLHR